MSLVWPARSFVWLMSFYRLAYSFVCLELLSLIGSARRDVSAEGRAAMLSWCMVGASGGQRHDVNGVKTILVSRMVAWILFCPYVTVVSFRCHKEYTNRIFLIITTESQVGVHIAMAWRDFVLTCKTSVRLGHALNVCIYPHVFLCCIFAAMPGVFSHRTQF